MNNNVDMVCIACGRETICDYCDFVIYRGECVCRRCNVILMVNKHSQGGQRTKQALADKRIWDAEDEIVVCFACECGGETCIENKHMRVAGYISCFSCMKKLWMNPSVHKFGTPYPGIYGHEMLQEGNMLMTRKEEIKKLLESKKDSCSSQNKETCMFKLAKFVGKTALMVALWIIGSLAYNHAEQLKDNALGYKARLVEISTNAYDNSLPMAGTALNSLADVSVEVKWWQWVLVGVFLWYTGAALVVRRKGGFSLEVDEFGSRNVPDSMITWMLSPFIYPAAVTYYAGAFFANNILTPASEREPKLASDAEAKAAADDECGDCAQYEEEITALDKQVEELQQDNEQHRRDVQSLKVSNDILLKEATHLRESRDKFIHLNSEQAKTIAQLNQKLDTCLGIRQPSCEPPALVQAGWSMTPEQIESYEKFAKQFAKLEALQEEDHDANVPASE